MRNTELGISISTWLAPISYFRLYNCVTLQLSCFFPRHLVCVTPCPRHLARADLAAGRGKIAFRPYGVGPLRIYAVTNKIIKRFVPTPLNCTSCAFFLPKLLNTTFRWKKISNNETRTFAEIAAVWNATNSMIWILPCLLLFHADRSTTLDVGCLRSI